MLYPDWAHVWADFPWYYSYYTMELTNCQSGINDAGTHGFSVQGFNDLLYAIVSLKYAVEGILGDQLDTFANAFSVNLWYYAHGGTLDMDTLLNVMLTADFEQLTQFVGISDAYRSAIWDQPFNSQFYAALAQGFRAQL
jgi:hypothetical protein